jgi:NAD(P)-dependent dehydrogenase (short-subunit alcohol dehydrogenase family)
MKSEYNGRVVPITGGGSGLGFAMAEAFAGAGALAAISWRDRTKLDAACARLGSSLKTYVHDVAELRTTPGLVAQIEEDVGPINCLVNNAGAHLKALPEDVGDEDLQRVISTNLTGVFVICRECAKFMALRGNGSILMISSMAALVGIPRVAVYSITKSGLLGATMPLVSVFLLLKYSAELTLFLPKHLCRYARKTRP